MATIENNSWIQAIYFMLSSNGYRESWLYPPGVNGNFWPSDNGYETSLFNIGRQLSMRQIDFDF